MESTAHPDVFAVGDAVAFADPSRGNGRAPGPGGGARNVVSRITQRGRYRTYQPHLMCALDMGAGKGHSPTGGKPPGKALPSSPRP